jgi:hypothetical protein
MRTRYLILHVFFPYVTVVCMFSGPPHDLHHITCESGFEFDVYCSGFTSEENGWEIGHTVDSHYYILKSF